MILIITNQNDISVSNTLSWLSTYPIVIRLNQEDKFYIKIQEIENPTLVNIKKMLSIKIKDSQIIWMWRGKLKYHSEEEVENVFSRAIDSENSIVSHFMESIWENMNYKLGSIYKSLNHNKLVDLLQAKTVGLSIPNIYDLIDKPTNVILKPYKDNYDFAINNFYLYTNNLLIKNPKSQNTYSAFLQQYIEKQYEIRIFYLKEKCYSMAIFSQLDEKTKIDYRNYNKEKPNRNVPYILPIEIEDKIRLFMNKSGLDTGSIDIIKSTDGRYVFLEVNPCGQFDWLSVNCNYYIEKKIAHYLAYGNTEFD